MKPLFKNPVAVGLSLGIYFGIALFLFGLSARLFGYCKILVSFMKTFYIGYDYTLIGSFVGLLRGFLDAFVAGFVITLLIQYFQKKFK